MSEHIDRARVPVPHMNRETRAFWDATAEGKLLIGSCEDCGASHYYPRTICPFCASTATRLRPASGRGVVYSYSVYRRSPQPYCLAHVTLEEGVTMLTNLIDIDFDAITIGMPVRIDFVDTGQGCALPCFTRA